MPVPAAQLKMERTDPWKEDGNIILVAEGKAFRAHRTVLSAYSEVFKDMFHCPSPNRSKEELIENCPVVHLGDAANDVQIMLKAMYDRSYPSLYYEKTPFSVVSAFLRLGDKYSIPAFVKEAKAKLCCNSDPTSIKTASLMTSSSNLFPQITDRDPHDFGIMNLLQEMGIKFPLPIAMYRCTVTCPSEHVARGYRANGSAHMLSRPNLHSFMLMKDLLQRYQMRLVKGLFSVNLCNHCTPRPLRQLWSEDINVAMPPFGDWQSRWDMLTCQTCKTDLKAKREAEMEQAWGQIPSAFGFQSWEQMRKSSDLPSFTIHAF